MRARLARRAAAAVGALALVGTALIGTQLAVAAPAGAAPAGVAPAAVGGSVLTRGFSASDTRSVKSARADCPAGKEVVGGGGAPFLSSSDFGTVRLIELRPVHNNNGPDGYVATAMALGAVPTGNWSLEADAVCADRVPGLYLAGGAGAVGSAPVQSAEAGCQAGEAVLGGGGLLRNPGFQADLRTVAPSATGDRFVVQGGEDVDGYANNWSVVAYAICAPRPAGYEVISETSPSNPTDERKTITGRCPIGKHLTGPGVATDPTSPGGIGLENLFPQPNLTASQALAEITQPPVVPWATMRTLAICVS
ncbi:MAG TPA: hypothetical protein VLM05_04865 [Mycobacteriales bacterium]|nr:hypothetical protein [Mycobacteriales bacterium]